MRSSLRALPNVLSVLSIAGAVAALVIGGPAHNLFVATFYLAAAALLLVADGVAAEALDASTPLGEGLLGSVSGLSVAVSSVGVLIWNGYVPWWVGLVLAIVAGLLEAVHRLFAWQPEWEWVQAMVRHTYYLQPFLTVATVMISLLVLVAVSMPGAVILPSLVILAVIYGSLLPLRAARLQHWLDGPPSLR